jgi:hypothetical protein
MHENRLKFVVIKVFRLFCQSNARRIFNNRWDEKSRMGKIAKLGLAPLLWCMIISLLITYISSVITCM